MISTKDRYENAKLLSKIVQSVFEKEIESLKAEELGLKNLLQKECLHTNKSYEEVFDYHKREDWVYCHCTDCGKYLGRK
jgi:site-specific DNA-adenine methylase